MNSNFRIRNAPTILVLAPDFCSDYRRWDASSDSQSPLTGSQAKFEFPKPNWVEKAQAAVLEVLETQNVLRNEWRTGEVDKIEQL